MEKNAVRILGELFSVVTLMTLICFVGIAVSLWHASQARLDAYQYYYVVVLAYGAAAVIGVGYLLVVVCYGLVLVDRLFTFLARKVLKDTQ